MNLFRSVKALCVLSLFRSPLEKLLHEVEYTLCVHKQAAKPCAPFLEAARSRNRNPRASFMNRKSTLNFALTYISMVLLPSVNYAQKKNWIHGDTRCWGTRVNK